jgi:ubiquinone/menaquinone biosynthesis C-methylase UbiE
MLAQNSPRRVFVRAIRGIGRAFRRAARRAAVEGRFQLLHRWRVPTVENFASKTATSVEHYWSRHTVAPRPILSVAESEELLTFRDAEYPLFYELMGLWGGHQGEVILDYGCGPGNDVVGFITRADPGRVIGVDVSLRALAMAQRRLGLYGVDPGRVRLMRISDDADRIPLPDESIDYVHCAGSLQHVSHPERVLAELFRVLKPGCQGRIMVYNYDSLWLHLYVAYLIRLCERRYVDMPVWDSFSKTTDGEDCPVATPFKADRFQSMCREAGFEARFLGGYFARRELDLYREYAATAAADKRLESDHRSFLENLVVDSQGYPCYRGKPAGVGGVYRIDKV